MPNISQPPSVLSIAHAECIASFSSPVVFFSSSVRVSSPAISLCIFSIVIYGSLNVIIKIIRCKSTTNFRHHQTKRQKSANFLFFAKLAVFVSKSVQSVWSVFRKQSINPTYQTYPMTYQNVYLPAELPVLAGSQMLVAQRNCRSGWKPVSE